MKILMIGCGVIGTIYGWALSQAKHDVTHLVRKNKIATLQPGIKLDIYDLRNRGMDSVTQSLLNAVGRGSGSDFESNRITLETDEDYICQKNTIYHPKLLVDIPDNHDFELVIVPTKHYQLIDTLKQIAPRLRKAKILIFCARWDDLSEIDQVIPRSQYLLGYSASSGGYESDVMVVNIRGDYRIGDYDGTHSKLLGEIVEMFAKANFTPDIKANILEWLWVHHAMNGALIGSLGYAGGFEAFHDPKFAYKFHAATLEAFAVLKKRGVNVESFSDTEAFLQQTPEQVLEHYRKLFVDTPIGQRILRAGHHKHAIDEMCQYYFDVLNTGKKLDVAMPILSSYYEAIHQKLLEIKNR